MKKFLLAILSLGSVTLVQAQTTSCTQLFFSEYVEGSSHSKALEIYNPTASPIALSNYKLIRFSNGSATPVDSFNLTGTIAAHDVWVVTNGQVTPDANSAFCDPILMAMADQVGPAPYATGTAVMFFNGDDAIVLATIAPRTFIDIFGKIGEDPGVSWSDVFPYTDAQGSWWTLNHTLIRKSTVTGGVLVNPTAFNVTTEWDSLPQNTWTNLGMHTSTCNTSGIVDVSKTSFVSVYPNPSNGTFAISSSSAMKSTTIFNALGEVIATTNFSSVVINQEIDLSAQPAGIYLMQVEFVNGQKTISKISIR